MVSQRRGNALRRADTIILRPFTEVIVFKGLNTLKTRIPFKSKEEPEL